MIPSSVSNFQAQSNVNEVNTDRMPTVNRVSMRVLNEGGWPNTSTANTITQCLTLLRLRGSGESFIRNSQFWSQQRKGICTSVDHTRVLVLEILTVHICHIIVKAPRMFLGADSAA